jgi:hypothetical protein
VQGGVTRRATGDQIVNSVEVDLGVASPSYARTLSQLIKETNIPVSLFGVEYGLTSGDQSAAMNNIVDHLQNQYLSASYNSDLKQVDYAVDLGAGTIRLNNPVTPLPFGVRVYGRGGAHTKIAGYGAFTAFSTQEFESDGITRRYHNNMRFEDFIVMSMLTGGNRTKGFRLRNMIRNCGVQRVGHLGCEVGFDLDWSWTLAFKDCFGQGGAAGQPITSATNHHFYLGTDNGAITIDGGRYDLADEPHFYAVGSDTLEVFFVNDPAMQFGKKGAVKILSARSVRMESGFFEGNCIGNPSEYYLSIVGSNSTLSTCAIKDVVINNLADSNRNGLGIASIDRFRVVDYSHRWVRNGVSAVPIIGENVFEANVKMPTADQPDALSHFSGPNAASATGHISRQARPEAIWGKALANTNGDNGAAVIGHPTDGAVLIGSRNAYAALQAVAGTVAADMELNPVGGSVRVPSLIRALSNTSSNLTPTKSVNVAVIDTTSGNRSVFMDGISFTPASGYEIVVVKLVAANNLIFVPPVGTDTINGVAGSKTVTNAGEYTFRKQSATAWLLTYTPFA